MKKPIKKILLAKPPLTEGINAKRTTFNTICSGRCCPHDRHKSYVVEAFIEKIIQPNLTKLVPTSTWELHDHPNLHTETIDFTGVVECLKHMYLEGFRTKRPMYDDEGNRIDPEEMWHKLIK